MNKLIAVLCLSLVVVLAATSLPAEAGTKAIWPDQCKPASEISIAHALETSRQEIDYLSGASGSTGIFDCEVKLPVGTRVTYFAINASTSDHGWVTARLRRMKLADENEDIAFLSLESEFSPKEWYPAAYIEPASARVASGYRYFVRLAIYNAWVCGAKVSYR